MNRLLIVVGVFLSLSICFPDALAYAQDAGAGDGGGAAVSGNEGGGGGGGGSGGGGGAGFFQVVSKSGFVGIMLWLAIFSSLGACVYFIVDCSITVRPERIMPPNLVHNVTEAMEQGDVLKALDACEQEPGGMANILSAGFSHVEEGFDVIQESIQSAAELESEQLMQRITYLSVVGNLAPMLGLLGTVQGMIRAFATLAVTSGAAKTQALALNISQALYTTAFGLSVAIPAVAAYFIFRNKANKIVLQMEGITIDLIKDLRNVEVVDDAE